MFRSVGLMSGLLARQLVNAVNPRLALYTRAAFLAACILVLNYVAVAGLSILMMNSSAGCSEITVVDRSMPVTTGDFLVYNGFINDTLARARVVSSSGVTVTTTVSGCVKRSVAMVVAPHPQQVFLQHGLSLSSTAYAQYAGTGVVVQVPCWNVYVPCWPGRSSANIDYENPTVDNLGCSFYSGVAVSGVPASAAYAPGNQMGQNADKFPWCSAEEEEAARDHYVGMHSMSSDVFGGATVDLNYECGSPFYVAPGGVLTELYPGASGVAVDPSASLTPFTTYWALNITTVTRTCPSFPSAFGQALGIATQIELVITIVLIFVFKKAGVIRLADGMVDMGEAGAQGVIDKSKLSVDTAKATTAV